MKKLLAVFLVGAMLFLTTGCSWFGKNDNPPMRIPAADDRLV